MFKAPVFVHVEVIDAKVGPSGRPSTNPVVKCRYCQKQFAAGSHRIRGHLLGLKNHGVGACPAVPESVQVELQAIQNGKTEMQQKRQRLSELDSLTQSSAYEAGGSNQLQSTLPEAFKLCRKENCDAAVARFFMAEGIPFQKIESPYFKDMLLAACEHGHGYKPPTQYRLRTDLLEKEVSFVKGQLESHMDTMKKTGASICSDGWSDTCNRPLLNMIIVTHKGSVFDSAVNTEGHTKDADYICKQVSVVIDRIGVENVVQVITDSAASCVRAGKLLMQKYPSVTWAPCVAHCIDLLLEDIGKLDWVKEIVKPARDVARFITNHHTSLAIFRQHSKKQILRPGETRFATNFIMLQRLKEVRKELQTTVLDEKWEQWVERERYHIEDAADACKKTIMDNVFFRSVDDLLAFVRPAIEIMRMADANVPSTGKIYWSCFSLLEHARQFRGLVTARHNQLQTFIRNRWDMLHSPLHATGYVLDPEFHDHEVESNEEVMTGFHDMVERTFPNSIQDQVATIQQLASFRQKLGIFGRANAMMNARSMPAHSWWSMYGSTVPQLQKLAIRVLAQPTSACACERNWSTYDYIHSKKRNRLDFARAEKLVYVFSNLRLLKNMQALTYEEQCWTWDEDVELAIDIEPATDVDHESHGDFPSELDDDHDIV